MGDECQHLRWLHEHRPPSPKMWLCLDCGAEQAHPFAPSPARDDAESVWAKATREARGLDKCPERSPESDVPCALPKEHLGCHESERIGGFRAVWVTPVAAPDELTALRAAQAQALRDAATDYMNRGVTPGYPGNVAAWLRVRADRLEPTDEFQDSED